VSDERRRFEITWPLHAERKIRRFPEDPSSTLSSHTPQSGALRELKDLANVPESSGTEEAQANKLRDSMPPPAPDWMRAAQTLVAELTELLRAGPEIDAPQESALARAWAAWSLGGASEAHVLRTAHIVMRAHSALRDAPERGNPRGAHMAAARVLHAGLPSALRDAMPLERALLVIKEIDGEPDAWSAVVRGTSELLGWTDHARSHAAVVVRMAIEQDYAKRHVD
jgi:hypothetical protein